MRVISGKLGKRLFEAPEGKVTHPMSERIKGALFNSLGTIEDKSILDAFAGTGALGFEAWSRGADPVTLVEKDSRTFKTMESNAKSLGVDEYVTTIKGNVSTWIDSNNRARFDIIFCDPPFDKRSDHIVLKLTDYVAPQGLLIVSQSVHLDPIEDMPLRLIDSKRYADAIIYYYKAD